MKIKDLKVLRKEVELMANRYERHAFICIAAIDCFGYGDSRTHHIKDELLTKKFYNFSGGGFGKRSSKKANLCRLMLLDFIILSKSKG